MIEQEYKELLTKEQFNELLKEFSPDNSITQINHYYADKEGVLSEKRITLRVREIGSKFKLELKMPVSEAKGLHIKKEHSERLTGLPEYFNGDKISEIINCKVNDCYRLGSLTTERHSYKWDKHTEICLDKSSYFDTVDYEIEVEYSKKFDKKLKDILSRHYVSFEHECKGKYSRFLEKRKVENDFSHT